MPSWVTASSSAGSSPAAPADRAPLISDYFRDSRSHPTTFQGVARRARPKNSVDAARGVEVGLAPSCCRTGLDRVPVAPDFFGAVACPPFLRALAIPGPPRTFRLTRYIFDIFYIRSIKHMPR